MSEKNELVSQVLLIAENHGLTKITTIELNNGGNLSIHLAPYPVVARIATVLSKEDPDLAYQILDRELQVAYHLQTRGVPVLLPADIIDAGPHNIAGTWMTFWKFEPREQLPRPSPVEAVELVSSLSDAMKDYPGELPVFGIWERTCKSAVRLQDYPDQRVQTLLGIFQGVNEKMRLERDSLIPCHGDANVGNLFPCNKGWIWMDFEDVSLMPIYWDLASFVCIPALFRGTREPTLIYVMDHIDKKSDLKSFGLALIARTLMSTLGNLDYALRGHGDLDFALKELEIAADFIQRISQITGGNDN